MKEDRIDYYIPRFKLKLEWVITALVLPVLVSACFLLLRGSFEKNAIDLNQKLVIVSAGVFFTGFGAGIVEEIIFRGIIMNVVEKRFDRKVAIIVPSLLFGILHIIGMDFNLLSCALVILAGTMVGIMFSLIALKTKSVWNSAIVHALWNIIIIGGILNIGTSFNENSLYSYVLDTKSFVWTGGEFGIESSIIGVAGYVLVCLVAILLDKKIYRKNL
ncbi:CPBP family intramembrane glutamic endopeptidase [Anaerosporobacter sp.]|uniref:CPBP family intramembrane glutamic endopeptidase n=1 Tax=Anaerosporobacter sp. TaxID=1872529 RepID=UPI00286F6D94|nr:CPBP family intramembrane glutamic endopeptidase [Anaerosporobacter sp.]